MPISINLAIKRKKIFEKKWHNRGRRFGFSGVPKEDIGGRKNFSESKDRAFNEVDLKVFSEDCKLKLNGVSEIQLRIVLD